MVDGFCQIGKATFKKRVKFWRTYDHAPLDFPQSASLILNHFIRVGEDSNEEVNQEDVHKQQVLKREDK